MMNNNTELKLAQRLIEGEQLMEATELLVNFAHKHDVAVDYANEFMDYDEIQVYMDDAASGDWRQHAILTSEIVSMGSLDDEFYHLGFAGFEVVDSDMLLNLLTHIQLELAKQE